MKRGRIMQGLLTDWLNPKRIRTINTVNSLKRIIPGNTSYAPGPNENHPVVTPGPVLDGTPVISAVANSSRPAIGVLQSRIYDGTITVSGKLTAGSGQTFSGDVTLTVTNPDGSQKSNTAPLDFFLPLFTVTHGQFNYSDSSGFDFSELSGSVNVGGSFYGSQAAISESLSIPFTGFVNGTTVSGSILGSGLLKTAATVLISGTAADQKAYAGDGVKPFRNITVVDLNNATETATVTLSKPANGILSNLPGERHIHCHRQRGSDQQRAQRLDIRSRRDAGFLQPGRYHRLDAQSDR
jgi:hypothetical protein